MSSFTKRIGRIICCALVAAVGVSGCTCSEKQAPNDDAIRLQARIDVASVHLYAAAKAALSRSDVDPALKATRDKVLTLVVEGQGQDVGSIMASLSLGDLMVLGTAVMGLKEQGKGIVAGTAPEGEPLVRLLLQRVGAPKGYVKLVDADMDHALLFLAAGSMRLSAAAPVPIPEEVVLYEASRTDPSALTVPGTSAFVYGLRAYFYGTNDFCHLAEADAKGADEAAGKMNLLLKGIGIFTEGAAGATVQDLQLLIPAIRILSGAGVAACYFKRGDTDAARPWLKQVVDEVKRTGLAGPRDTALLEILHLCGGDADEIAEGTAALAAIPAGGDPNAEWERQMATAYCQATAEAKGAIIKKYTLAKKAVQIAEQSTKNSKILQTLVDSKAYRAALSAAALSGKVVAAKDSMKGAVDTLKGLLKPSENTP